MLVVHGEKKNLIKWSLITKSLRASALYKDVVPAWKWKDGKNLLFIFVFAKDPAIIANKYLKKEIFHISPKPLLCEPIFIQGFSAYFSLYY